VKGLSGTGTTTQGTCVQVVPGLPNNNHTVNYQRLNKTSVSDKVLSGTCINVSECEWDTCVHVWDSQCNRGRRASVLVVRWSMVYSVSGYELDTYARCLGSEWYPLCRSRCVLVKVSWNALWD